MRESALHLRPFANDAKIVPHVGNLAEGDTHTHTHTHTHTYTHAHTNAHKQKHVHTWERMCHDLTEGARLRCLIWKVLSAASLLHSH